MLKRTKNEKQAIKIFSWLLLVSATISYFTIIQFILKIENIQFAIMLIFTAIWIFVYENAWKYIKEKNK